LQGGITGVFCKYWYPFLHRITEPKSPSAVTSAIFAKPPPGRVFRKTVADTLLFVALSFGSLVVAVSTADGAVQDVQKHLEKWAGLVACSCELLVYDLAGVWHRGHPVSAEAMTDFLAIAEDARIIVNNRPSATWIVYPALSWALFRTVPLPLQGIAGIAQTLAMATGTIVLHRHELIEVNEAIANVEELFTYAGEHESELDDMIEQVERAIVESDRAIREQIEEQMTGKPTKDRDSTV
jgi:hypothetical protein